MLNLKIRPDYELNFPDRTSSCGCTPLMWLIQHVELSDLFYDEIITILKSDVIQINQRNNQGWTPLLILSKIAHEDRDYDYTSLADTLLKYGANPNFSNKHDFTPLDFAIQNKNLGLVKVLLKYNVDLERERNGTTPLIRAIRMGYDPVIYALLDGGADPNKTESPSDFSPLMLSVRLKRYDLIKTLLERKYNVNIHFANKNNLTALDVCSDDRINELLKSYGIKSGSKVCQSILDMMDWFWNATSNPFGKKYD